MESMFETYRQFEILIPAKGRKGAAHCGEELTGFIMRPAVKTGLNNKMRKNEQDDNSTQLDILIYDSAKYPIFQRFGDSVIVPPEGSYGYSIAGKIPWSHLRSIMRISDEDERNFYLNEVMAENWSVRVLERNIKSGYYKRMLSTQLPDKENKVLEFVKDPFVLEFMGKGFSFVGRQMRICTETTDFYIDLVFYNYILKCFVIIDLKTKKLTHQDIGQMDMYVRMFDDLKRREDDNRP